jgi:hypothetical protein
VARGVREVWGVRVRAHKIIEFSAKVSDAKVSEVVARFRALPQRFREFREPQGLQLRLYTGTAGERRRPSQVQIL